MSAEPMASDTDSSSGGAAGPWPVEAEEAVAPPRTIGQRARRALHVFTTPRLLREQIVYWTRGPAKGPPERWPGTAPTPWVTPPDDVGAWCPICQWHGDTFEGIHHVESQLCPACGSNARERFLFHCFISRTPPTQELRVLETSPRLGQGYRRAMRTWFSYRASDLDGRAHKADLEIDLQDMALPSEMIDVILCAHVLEHVPEPPRALAELHRVLAPGGRLYLQVPILQAVTGVPSTPEFHDDDTPVHWRFGFDLTAELERAGFDCTLVSTEQLVEVARSGGPWPGATSGEFDVDAIVATAPADDIEVLDAATARRLGLHEGYMFFTWECRRGD
jgi:SAM-dependent methyltransferase